MPSRQDQLDRLWEQLENAKLRMDTSHQSVRETRHDKITEALPVSDGLYAHARALREEEQAATAYMQALNDFKAALAVDQAPAAPTSDAEALQLSLTPRERAVLKLIASGKSSKQVGEELGIAFRTVVCHRYRIYKKLMVHNSVDLTRAAMRMGLIRP